MREEARSVYDQANAALRSRNLPQAVDLIDQAREMDASDKEIASLYVSIHLARGVIAASDARNKRRDAIRQVRPGPGDDFRDDERTLSTFRNALADVQKVLSVDPGDPKAITLKAGILLLMDRGVNRSIAIDLLNEVLRAHPESKDTLLNLRKISQPCQKCGDTGFCPDCGGTGERVGIVLTKRCERCMGRGVCVACGII